MGCFSFGSSVVGVGAVVQVPTRIRACVLLGLVLFTSLQPFGVLGQLTIVGGDGREVVLEKAPDSGLKGFWQYSLLTEQDIDEEKRTWASSKVSVVDIPTYDKIPHVAIRECPAGSEEVDMHYTLYASMETMPRSARQNRIRGIGNLFC